MADIITKLDNRLYKAWNKLVESLQTNKPPNAADGGGLLRVYLIRQDRNRQSKRF
jgi:hypothetical protein